MEDGEHQQAAGAEADNDRNKSVEERFADANTRFRSYVTFYSNLDNLIWKNVATLLTVTGIGGGVIATIFGRSSDAILGIPQRTAAAAAFGVVSALYLVTTFTLWRMRYHHVLIENDLRNLEPSGYFHRRKESVSRWWLSATTWNMVLFFSLGVASLVAAIFYFVTTEPPMGKRWIDAEQASSRFGIIANHEVMKNGELRFRLMGSDGNGYVRTVTGDSGGWQKSHYHRGCRETYIVERGWMAIATPSEVAGQARIQVFEAGQIYTSVVQEIHNVYLPENATIHTVKHGSSGTAVADWHPADAFDTVIARISRAQLEALRRGNQDP